MQKPEMLVQGGGDSSLAETVQPREILKKRGVQRRRLKGKKSKRGEEC